MGFERTVDQNLQKKNDEFYSNGVLDLREKKVGFWTNGGIEIY